jgi:hypothetical protein
VVVTLDSTVIFVSAETLTVITKMKDALCRFDNGLLYLLDPQNGIVLALRGLDQLGTRRADQAHAVELLKRASPSQGENSNQFREAARILGCQKARDLFRKQLEPLNR